MPECRSCAAWSAVIQKALRPCRPGTVLQNWGLRAQPPRSLPALHPATA